jgi:hypothetical protein
MLPDTRQPDGWAVLLAKRRQIAMLAGSAIQSQAAGRQSCSVKVSPSKKVSDWRPAVFHQKAGPFA